MQQIGVATAALFPNRESASEAIRELTRIGVPRDEIRAGMRSDRMHRAFVEEHGVDALRSASIESGILSSLARLTEAENAHPERSLEAELFGCGVGRDYARYFDDALGAENVLLVIPASSPSSALGVFAARRADLGSGTFDALVELRAERLDVGKRIVTAGEVVLRTEVITEVQRFELELEREEMVIEHHRVGPQGELLPPEITRIPIRHEEVDVDKRTVVTGRVVARTERIVETQHVTEMVRREVLDVSSDRPERVHDATIPPRAL